MARAARRGGVVTLAESRRAGVSDRIMTGLVHSGVLRRPHPGVFVLAGMPAGHAVCLRAALAYVGHGAVASHGSAAWLHGFVDKPPPRPVLTTRVGGRMAATGVVVHRSATASVPTARIAGIICTDTVRTLVDLAAGADPSVVTAALDRALSRGALTLDDLERVLPSRRRGVGRVRACLIEHGYLGAPAPSVLESHMTRILSKTGLAPARAELLAGPGGRYRIDFAYPEVKLAIECYGYAWHHSPVQMTNDLRRQRQLAMEGWTVLVYTWRDVTDHPSQIVREIEAAHLRLSRRPG